VAQARLWRTQVVLDRQPTLLLVPDSLHHNLSNTVDTQLTVNKDMRSTATKLTANTQLLEVLVVIRLAKVTKTLHTLGMVLALATDMAVVHMATTANSSSGEAGVAITDTNLRHNFVVARPW